MTITLGTFRQAVQSALDDVEAARWSTTEIDRDGAIAVEQIMSEGASAGLDIFNTTTTVTLDSNGKADLSALPGGMPIKVSTVAQLNGTSRLLVQPSRRRHMLAPASGLTGQTVEVTYVPRPVFPTSSNNPVTYGTSGVNSAILDALAVAITASSLKVKEQEINSGLENRKQELFQSLLNTANNPSAYIMPFAGSRGQSKSMFSWVMAGQSLQLFLEQGF